MPTLPPFLMISPLASFGLLLQTLFLQLSKHGSVCFTVAQGKVRSSLLKKLRGLDNRVSLALSLYFYYYDGLCVM